MNIFLIRHSEQLRLKGIKKAKEDSQTENEKIILSVEGEEKAKEISKLEELNSIELLWSSNYVRSIATSKYIAGSNNIDINIDERLNERKLRKLRNFKKTRRR